MEERFKRIDYQTDTEATIITYKDIKTGVNYMLIHRSRDINCTSAPCIIPLLDKDGKPYISKEE